MNFDEVFSYKNLYRSYRKCLKGVRWKGTVQRYEMTSLTNLYLTYEELRKGTLETGKFYKFDIIERGKLRHIKSVGIKERVVQRCLCDYCLVPRLSKEFVYDNYACLKDKGYHFAIKRVRYFLIKYYRKHHTNDGYILQYDLHHYFDTIPHDELIKKVSLLVDDEDLLNLYIQLVTDFEGDRGIGLGSQISQISALFYPNEIDHHFKGIKELDDYGRYMDDGLTISPSKELLRKCLNDLKRLCDKLGIQLNENKTQISKLSHGFTFLKARFFLTPTGKVIVKPNKKGITKNRRKIKKLAKTDMPRKELKSIIDTILGGLKFYNAYYTRRNLEMLKEEIITENGKSLVKHSSDEGKRIVQVETGLVFEEAVDEMPCKFTYVEEGSEEEVSGGQA